MTLKHLGIALMASTLFAAQALAAETNSMQNNAPGTTHNANPAQTTAAAQTAQQADQWRTSKIVGLNVYNTNNEKVGDINELILDKDGQIDLVVIGAGGFLGMGEHNVALKWDQVKFVDESAKSSSTSSARPTSTTGSASTAPVNAANANRDYPDHAVVNMTKDQLKALPAFKYNSDTKSR